MINLLPPDLKSQVKYAKLNRLVLNYLRITVVVVIVLAGIFAWALIDIGRRTAEKAVQVAEDQKQVTDLSKSFLPKAEDASERLNAIKYVQESKTKYSAVLADIAKVLPAGVKIHQLTLTGDDSKPVAITVDAPTYDSVLALRNALVTSPRISSADITSITGAASAWTGELVFGFKAGQAK